MYGHIFESNQVGKLSFYKENFISVVFDRSYMIGKFNGIKERERQKLDKDAMTMFFV